MKRSESKIAQAAEKEKLKEIMGRKGRLPHPKEAAGEMEQAGNEAFSEEQRELRRVAKPETFKKGGQVMKKIKEYGGMETYASKAAMKKHEAKETPMEEKLEKKMGKGMARADMQKVATKAVKGHEKRMHGMAKGGGIETKGKTKGKMVKMAKGGKIDGCAVKGKTKGKMV